MDHLPEPLLFPRPRRIDRLDPSHRHVLPLAEVPDPTLPAQGFALTVGDERAELRHADDAGLRYGRQTVQQLRDADGTLPTVSLSDHPDFATRGFMLDVSRDRVPTRETLARLVEVLATCRYNQLQLYVEHAFAYRDHAEVWADASPIDAADLTWLDGVCASAGIELVANQNCFGHLGPWLALETYRPRAECPDGYEVAPGLRFPPAVLAPTDDNAELVLALVREQSAALRSSTVNVGCDETFELGLGVSRERVERDGRAAVYLEHLHRIVDPLVAEGILKLLLNLQKIEGVAYLFITHDLATVKAIADSIAVMYKGQVVRYGTKTDVLSPPFDDYTDLLLSSVPEMQQGWLEGVIAHRKMESGGN